MLTSFCPGVHGAQGRYVHLSHRLRRRGHLLQRLQDRLSGMAGDDGQWGWQISAVVCWFETLPGTPQVQPEAGRCPQRAGRDPESSRQMAAVISKGSLHTRSVLGGNKTNSSPHLPAKSYKLIKRPQLGSVTYTTQVFSTVHQCLKALSLEQLLGVGKASGTHILRTRGRGERSLSARGQLSGQ